jgi:hypothetical protein
MPPAILIPVAAMVATTAFSAINQNIQNKAANKNNLNQQAGAVQNAQVMRQKAMNWVGANPPPASGAHTVGQNLGANGQMKGPSGLQAAAAPSAPAMARPGTPGVPAGQQPGMGLSPGGSPAGAPGGAGAAALIQAIMKARGMQGYPAPVAPPSGLGI